MIELIHEANLSASDDAQIAALLAQSFPTDFGGRSYYQQRPQMRLVWRSDRIESQVSLFYRAIRLGEDLVDVIGIGDVATLPDARGQGHCTALFDRAIKIAETSRAQFLLLFGERGLYHRAGFRPVQIPYRHVQMEGARTGEIRTATSRFFKVRPVSGVPWPRDLEVDFLGPLF